MIKVGIIGVGNCAKSLVEGVALYSETNKTNGLAFPLIGGYSPFDIQFVLAYDIDTSKVGRSLPEAINAVPNCAYELYPQDKLPWQDVIVKRGALYDGVASHMITAPREEGFRPTKDPEPSQEDVVKDLKDSQVDVLLNYLPVGSETATRFYVECALKAGVPFINCIPVFIASDPYWHKRFFEKGIPLIGDDMRSQFGASVLSQMLQELAFNRGLDVQFHKQTNEGGNTDFLNMMDSSRIISKKISKENVIRSQNDIRNIPVPKNGIYAGPSSYIPYYKDNKIAYFRLEMEGFGGAPIELDIKLSVQDSPNSAGVVIDAIRYIKVAQEMGMAGSLHGPSAFTQKTPPEQMMFEDAYKECEALSKRQWTESTLKWNKK